MDSMRGLGRALTSTTPRKSSKHDRAANVRQSFKAAALSVTNLYRAVAAEADEAYAEGYQDALKDLLTFLDKRDLGLTDGEGWMVREWATQRYQSSSSSLGAEGSGAGGPQDTGARGKEKDEPHRGSSPPAMQQEMSMSEAEPPSKSEETMSASDPDLPRRQDTQHQPSQTDHDDSAHAQTSLDHDPHPRSQVTRPPLGPGAGFRRKAADDDLSLHAHPIKTSRRDHSTRTQPRDKVANALHPPLPNAFFDEFAKLNPSLPTFPGSGV